MALGTYRLGDDFLILVSTSQGGTYEVIDMMNSYRKNSTRNLQSFPVFNRAVAPSIPGAREVTFTISGYASQGDGGQDLLRTAELNNTTVWVKVLPDGTNGFVQEVRVGSRTHETGPEGLQGVSFECTAVGDRVAVGSGAADF